MAQRALSKPGSAELIFLVKQVDDPAVLAHPQAVYRLGFLKHPVPLEFFGHARDHGLGGEGLAAADAVERCLFLERAGAIGLVRNEIQTWIQGQC